MKLIDREVTLLLLDESIKQFGANWLQDKLTKNGLLIAKQIVSKQPTIEPELRHGRWIQQESPNGIRFNCSECGHEFTVPCSEMIDPRDYVCYLDDYCGKCGTRMDATDTNYDDKGGIIL